MIYAKCKTCRNRNTDKCPLKKKDAKEQKVEKEEIECFETEEVVEASKNKGAQLMQNATAATKRITGDLFRRMVLNASAYIKKNAEKINDLNVFPVPDGDTGSNMSMTIGSAVGDLKRAESTDEIGDVAALTASAMLRGARGNSGVILSLLFRGISKELKGVADCDGVAFANALNSGVEAAYKAVTSPAEGTILTVARMAAARAIEAAREENSVEYVLEAACNAASDALDKTVDQNPVLKKAGVVDAGGMGWVVALTAMLDALHGNELEISDGDEAIESKASADFGDFNTEDIKFTYCTEFIVSRENDKDPEALRDFLSRLGDSLVVVSDEEIIKVHVHTNAPGTAMQEALTYGSFMTVKVENMKLQHTEKLTEESKPAAPKEPEKDFGAVAVAPGDGIAETFVSLGVDVTVSGGQTMNPSTEDILNAVNSVNAKTVFVLPNNKNIILAAEQAAMISEKKIVVIPTRSTPEGIAAMQGYDVQLTEGEITESMTEMAATADTMQITYAARNSEFDGMHISEGEYLALYAGKLAGNGRDLNALLRTLCERAKESGKEIITIYYGEDVSEEDAEKVASLFAEEFDEDSVMLIRGGQPVYYYIISAE